MDSVGSADSANLTDSVWIHDPRWCCQHFILIFMLHANMVMARFACLAVAPTLALRGCAFITQPPAYSCRASAGARSVVWFIIYGMVHQGAIWDLLTCRKWACSLYCLFNDIEELGSASWLTPVRRSQPIATSTIKWTHMLPCRNV